MCRVVQTIFPGVFSSRFTNTQHPSCEFLTLTKHRPFPALVEQSDTPEYLRLLGIDSPLEAWDSPDMPGFRLGRPLFLDYEDQNHLVLTARLMDVPETKLTTYGGLNTDGYINYLDITLSNFLVVWALETMLIGYERNSSRLRDVLPRGAQVSSRQVNRLLNHLRMLLENSVDIISASAELISFCRQNRFFRDEVAKFIPLNKPGATLEANLTEGLRRMIKERAERLRATDEAARELISQYATAQSTFSNLALQRTIKFLTWVTALIAVLTLLKDCLHPKSDLDSKYSSSVERSQEITTR